MLTVHEMVRLPLRAIPPTTVVRVLAGPNRGLKWVAGASTHGCWVGTYERQFAERFAAAIAPGMIVYDIGGHAGYYTLMAARQVGAFGHVVVFEPVATNIRRIQAHLTLNRFEDRTQCLPFAVGKAAGTATMMRGDTDSEWRFGGGGSLAAPVVCVDELIANGAIRPPNVVKMDIEGAEGDAIEGARQTLTQWHPALYVALHDETVTQRLIATLRECGYSRIERAPGAPGEDLFAHA